jgi:small subunit ribosomal protein S6
MYELIIAATTGGAESLISRVEKFLKEAEALELKINKLGRKQLAYPIRKQTEAEYFVLNFEAEGANLKSITDKLRLEQEDLLRYMVVSAKAFKPSKRKGKKVEEAVKVEKREAPKVTVVTKTSVKGKVKSGESKTSAKVTKESKITKVKEKAKKGKGKK